MTTSAYDTVMSFLPFLILVAVVGGAVLMIIKFSGKSSRNTSSRSRSTSRDAGYTDWGGDSDGGDGGD